MEFMDMYQTGEACRQALFEHRCPDGFVCPRCSFDRAYRLKTRPFFERAHCATYQASLTAGTILEGARVELGKWFSAIYLLAATEKTLSSAELSRQLGVAPQTAWTMRRKIMHAMARRESELMLLGLWRWTSPMWAARGRANAAGAARGKTPVAVMARP